jgi:hypothetical protein
MPEVMRKARGLDNFRIDRKNLRRKLGLLLNELLGNPAAELGDF